MNYFMLKDEYDCYGIVMTDICEEDFLKLLDEYRIIDEAYNSPGFMDFLSSKGIEATLIMPLEVYF